MDIGFQKAVEILLAGHPLIFPTDTVVGLGVAVEHASGPEALYRAKSRDAGKPIAWLVGGADALATYGRDVPEYARGLAKTFWPGALTLVVNASDNVSAAFRSSDGSIGLRMPDSGIALALIEAAKSPLATTSANLSGKPAASLTGDVDPAIAGSVAVLREDRRSCSIQAQRKGDSAIAQPAARIAATQTSGSVDGSLQAHSRQQKAAQPSPACPPSAPIASTVIAGRGSAPTVLRAGTITASQIEEALQRRTHPTRHNP